MGYFQRFNKEESRRQKKHIWVGRMGMKPRMKF